MYIQPKSFTMILCACFYIDKTEWFEEQFLYSRHLYNQGRYVINNHYKEHKNFISQTELNRILRNYEPEFNNYRNLCKAKLSQMILIHLCNNYKSILRGSNRQALFLIKPENFLPVSNHSLTY